MDDETRSVARSGPGPRYDAALRWLVASDPMAMCHLLGEEPIQRPVLLSESLPVSAVFPDALLQVAPDRLLHTEFVRRVEPDLGARMLEYRGRIMRRHPGMTLAQHVLVLAAGRFPVQFGDSEHSFRVHVTYLRNIEVHEVLSEPSLATLAVLARAPDEPTRLKNFELSLGAIKVGEPDPSRAGALMSAAGILATMRINGRTIRQTWKETFMSALTREDFENFWNALQPANEQERLEDIEYEKYREKGGVLRALIQRRFGWDDRLGRIATILARDFSLEDALDLFESADSYDALVSKLGQPLPPRL